MDPNMVAGQSVYQTLTVSYVDAQLAASDLTPHEITLVDAHRDRIQQSRQVSEPSRGPSACPPCSVCRSRARSSARRAPCTLRLTLRGRVPAAPPFVLRHCLQLSTFRSRQSTDTASVHINVFLCSSDVCLCQRRQHCLSWASGLRRKPQRTLGTCTTTPWMLQHRCVSAHSVMRVPSTVSVPVRIRWRQAHAHAVGCAGVWVTMPPQEPACEAPLCVHMQEAAAREYPDTETQAAWERYLHREQLLVLRESLIQYGGVNCSSPELS
jgi:hypothetical protein